MEIKDRLNETLTNELEFCSSFRRKVIPASCMGEFASWLEAKGFRILYDVHDRGHVKHYDYTAWNPVSEERLSVRLAPRIQGYARVVKDLFGRTEEFINEIREAIRNP